MNNKNPLVSIIVPVYNVEDYLGDCLDSLMCQTYDNFEVLMVDNCSTDSSYIICKEYAQKDSRFIPLSINEKGISVARNKGLDEAKGDWCIFVDSDDVVAMNYIELLIELAIKFDVDMVIGECKKVPENFKLHRVNTDSDSPTVGICEYDRKKLQINMLSFRIPMYACGKLYRMTLWETVRFPIGVQYEDVKINWAIGKLVNKSVKSNNPFYYYRQRYGSIVNVGFNKKRLDQVYVSEEIYEEVKNDTALRYMAATRCFFAIADSLSMITKGYNFERKKLYDGIRKYRSEVFKDKSAKKSIKGLALISYISIGLVGIIGRHYKKYKNRKYKIN